MGLTTRKVLTGKWTKDFIFQQYGIPYFILKRIKRLYSKFKIDKIYVGNNFIIQGRGSLFYDYCAIWKNREYDMPNFEISKGMNVLDIGANQGVFSLYAAHKGAQVYAFEPDKKNYSVLQKNIRENRLNGAIKSFNVAVSKKNGLVKLIIPFDKKNGLVRRNFITTSENFVNSFEKYFECQKIKINLVRSINFDEFLSDIAINEWDVLKIDCEGEEYNILTNLSDKNLGKIKRIVMETHACYNEKALLDFLQKKHFRFLQYKTINESGVGFIKAVQD